MAVGIVVAVTIVPATILAGRRPSLQTVVDVWAFFGTLTVIALAAIVGPLVLLLHRWLGSRLSVARATAAGAAVGPLLLLAAWFVIREGNETVPQLLSFWWRLPMEFVLGVLPFAAAAALFAGWLVAGERRRPRRIEPAATSS